MIRLLVDSASDMSKDDGVYFVPSQVSIDGHDYHDGIDLDRNTFYNLLTTSTEFPKTSQPSPHDFLNIFNEVKDNNDQLICITLSSALGGTYQSAMLAKNIVDYDDIYFIDSLSATYVIKMMVDKASKLIIEGKDIKEIVEVLEEMKKRIKLLASVNTLDYLYKGGRLSATSAFIGNIAKLKPIITVNEEGKVEVVGKRIGIAKSIEYIVDYLKSVELDEECPVYLLYTTGTSNVEKLAKAFVDVGINAKALLQIGSTIEDHVGPEAFGIIYMVK